jgi:hypothetical protein
MVGTRAGGASKMRPFKRVKMLNADEYRVLKKAVSSKIAAGKARRAKIVLLSNQGSRYHSGNSVR